MTRPTTLVTGANRGIGLEVARGLAEAGHRVLLAARTDAKARDACRALVNTSPGAEVVPLGGDLGTTEGLRALIDGARAQCDTLDCLIHNAAVISPRHVRGEGGIEHTLWVNHLAPVVLTAALKGLLATSARARVVVVASEAHRRARPNLDDLHFEHRPYRAAHAYAQSKLFNVLFAAALPRRWSGLALDVVAVHPGVVGTPLLGSLFGPAAWVRHMFRSPTSGASPVLALATSETSDWGTAPYYRRFKRTPPSPTARDRGLQDRLWELSEALVRPWGLV